jgi:uncharacterized small protein (DUF1192 family)
VTSTSVFLMDGYADRPMSPRAALELEIARLKVQMWADPGDKELREEVERLEAELRALERGRGAA